MRKWLLLVLGMVIAFWLPTGFSAQTPMLEFALAFGLAGALCRAGAPAFALKRWPITWPITLCRPRATLNGSPYSACGVAPMGVSSLARFGEGPAWRCWENLARWLLFLRSASIDLVLLPIYAVQKRAHGFGGVRAHFFVLATIDPQPSQHFLGCSECRGSFGQ